MTNVDESSDLFKVRDAFDFMFAGSTDCHCCQWNIAPVPGQINTFTIKPVSDRHVGMVSSDNNRQKYWGYGYPIGIIGESARWKIEKRDNSSSRSV